MRLRLQFVWSLNVWEQTREEWKEKLSLKEITERIDLHCKEDKKSL